MRLIILGLAAVAAVGTASSASAGVYSDDLGKCLVAKTTDADKTVLVQWIFSAMSAHPAVKQMSSETAEQRHAMDVKAGQLFDRLVTSDCRAETLAALKYEGSNSFQAAFGILGQAAMAQLMTDPAVARELQALGDGMDKSKMEALGREAGIAPPAGAAPHP